MQNQLKIPKTLKIGFQARSDTYSGKLAFIVYEDNGKIAKERSWKNWISEDIPVETYENVPTSGFVLNKDVGGAKRSSGWNPRMEKVRVYDPRGFEFEITTANLLFILQECTSTKGKGLEGEFVYSWDGKDLVLLPCDSSVYPNSLNFTSLQNLKLNKSEFVEGCLYLTKDQKEVIYLGKHLFLDEEIYRNNTKQYHIFELVCPVLEKPEIINDSDPVLQDYLVRITEHRNKKNKYLRFTDFSKIAKRLTDVPVEDFAERYTELTNSTFVSKIDRIVLMPVSEISKKRYWFDRYFVESEGLIRSANVYVSEDYCHSLIKDAPKKYKYTVELGSSIDLKKGFLNSYHLQKRMFLEKMEDVSEVLALVRKMKIICENGSSFLI